jgi:hypothetical protein
VVTKAGLTVELNLLYFYFFLAANSVNNIKSIIGELQERTCIRYFHTLIWKTGGSSPSDRNVMSFHEWSAAERVERHKKNLSRVEDPKTNPQILIRDTLWGSIAFSEIQSNLSYVTF